MAGDMCCLLPGPFCCPRSVSDGGNCSPDALTGSQQLAANHVPSVGWRAGGSGGGVSAGGLQPLWGGKGAG